MSRLRAILGAVPHRGPSPSHLRAHLQGCIKLAFPIKVGTFRRNVRVRAHADASARRLPLAVLVLPRLRGPSLSTPILAMLFLALLVYSALNWTAIFGHGMIAACLLAAPKPQKRRVLLYIAVAGLSSMLVVALSLVQKFGGAHGTGSGASLRDIVAGYGWGSTGYGTWLSTGKAAVRLLFVSVAGLLPLTCISFPQRTAFPTRRDLLPLCASSGEGTQFPVSNDS
jgi:hypothetical protein